LFLIFLTNLGRQLPEAREAAKAEDVAAESSNEANGGGRNPHLNYNIMGYCLWWFQMLMEIRKLKSVLAQKNLNGCTKIVFYFTFTWSLMLELSCYCGSL